MSSHAQRQAVLRYLSEHAGEQAGWYRLELALSDSALFPPGEMVMETVRELLADGSIHCVTVNGRERYVVASPKTVAAE